MLAVHTDGATITHTTDAPLTVGGTVEGCIDWPARLDAMQQHTGEHILSGTLHRLFGAENVGFHIGTPYVRMDTSIPLTDAQLAQAEAEANAAVRADTPVRCWVPDPETLAHTEYRSKKRWTATCGWWRRRRRRLLRHAPGPHRRGRADQDYLVCPLQIWYAVGRGLWAARL